MEANDMKAMREALERVEKLAREFAVGNYYVSDFPKMLLNAIQPALAKPPRNCDDGTAEEQRKRMMEYCKTHEHIDGIIICESCPLHGPDWTGCVLRWAQMPYKEGGAS